MIFHENRLLAEDLMKYHSIFFLKIRKKMWQNLSSAAVVIGGKSVNLIFNSKTSKL